MFKIICLLAGMARCFYCQPEVALTGYRPLSDNKEIEFSESGAVRMNKFGVFEFVAESYTKVRLFGFGLSNQTSVSIVRSKSNCTFSYELGNMTVVDGYSSTAVIVLHAPPETSKDGISYYFCFSTDRLSDQVQSEHQGAEPWKTIRIVKPQSDLPLSARIISLIVLLLFSATFSGLNLGLMTLDVTTLKITKEGKSKCKKRCAKIIYPVRKYGNYLLCTLLFGNVIVNSAFSILLEQVTNGYIAIAASTLSIVIFGEIIPQALCSRYGLQIGTVTIWLTVFSMIITFPLSFPISIGMYLLLGEDEGIVYNNDQLCHLLNITRDKIDLNSNEFNIIRKTLQLKDKTVGQLMTHIRQPDILEINDILDYQTIKKIKCKNFGHLIPVHDNNEIIGVLSIRDLPLNYGIRIESFVRRCQLRSIDINQGIHQALDDIFLDQILIIKDSTVENNEVVGKHLEMY